MALLIPNYDLQSLNTLAVPARAAYFAEVRDLDELAAVLAEVRARKLPLLVLGGGSNIVLRDDFPGLALKVSLLGRELVGEDDEYVWLEVGAGENWHQLVQYSLDYHFWGLENLALIPGSVGAAPIQNIGAYGVELKDVFSELKAMQVSTGLMVTFDRDGCEFGYRDSIFKNACKDRYVITSVTLKLRKIPQLNLDYPALREQLGDNLDLTPRDVAEAVCAVRRSKLPAVEDIPNVGSFFKNPVVSRSQFESLSGRFASLPAYDQGETGVKLAAGWLIDQCGWKGRAYGAAKVHEHQALVLTNPGRGSGSEVLALAGVIAASVRERFGVELEMEPRIYP